MSTEKIYLLRQFLFVQPVSYRGYVLSEDCYKQNSIIVVAQTLLMKLALRNLSQYISFSLYESQLEAFNISKNIYLSSNLSILYIYIVRCSTPTTQSALPSNNSIDIYRTKQNNNPQGNVGHSNYLDSSVFNKLRICCMRFHNKTKMLPGIRGRFYIIEFCYDSSKIKLLISRQSH